MIMNAKIKQYKKKTNYPHQKHILCRSFEEMEGFGEALATSKMYNLPAKRRFVMKTKSFGSGL